EGRKGLVAGLRPGAIHLSMSTISTAAASQLASAHARCGQGYVAAPVFGNPDAAKARQLFVVAAGAPADVERCRPLLDQLGQRTFVVGDDPAHANLTKLMVTCSPRRRWRCWVRPRRCCANAASTPPASSNL